MKMSGHVTAFVKESLNKPNNFYFCTINTKNGFNINSKFIRK